MININTIKSQMMEAIDSYLLCFQNTSLHNDTKILRLAQSMDKLVAAYNQSYNVEPENCCIDIPEIDYITFYAAAGKAFPSFGYYSLVEPVFDLDQKIMLADAIDDMADIAIDLTKVKWYFSNNMILDGIWEYRFGYQAHWGNHLHSLRGYLHSSDIAAW